ncbi:phosphate ABC transporter substrate-binding protein [Duganella fentianensis]|uniref:phosphate ABC transporter substrate-binding protein n=1 Tax=Duganella fentianensis TaxID=2692177 RepID=UPI0032B2E795
MKALPSLLACLILPVLLALPARADIIVIVSAKNPVRSLSNEQAVDLFLGKNNDFPNGAKAVPLDQSEGAGIRDSFYRKTTGKGPAQMNAHWARMLFTGRAQPPVAVGDSEAVKKLVAADASLIGYIDREALDSSVRAVLSIH